MENEKKKCAFCKDEATLKVKVVRVEDGEEKEVELDVCVKHFDEITTQGL